MNVKTDGLRKIILPVFQEDWLVYAADASVEHGYAFPDQFKVETVKGLLLCYILRREADDDLIYTLWQGDDYYKASSSHLQSVLGIRLRPLGFVSEPREKRESFARRILGPLRKPSAVAGILAASVAVYSNIDTMRSGFSSFFQSPSCELILEPPRQILQNEKQSVRIDARIRNPGTVAANIQIDSVVVEPKAKAEGLGVNLTRIPGIKPGEERTIQISLTPKMPGEFSVTLVGMVSNDWFRRKKFEMRPIEFVIWPVLKASYLECTVTPEGNRCWITGELFVGRGAESGVLYDFQLRRVPGVEFGTSITISSSAREMKISTNSDSGKELAHAEYDDAQKVEAFSKRVFRVSLRSQRKMSKEQWEAIAKEIEINVLPR